jgi:hypothetical protein
VVNEAVHLVPLALIAAFSPLGFAATLTVMRTGRVRALGFAIGVVGGQLLACAALVVLGDAVPFGSGRDATVEGLLELSLGAALLVIAFVLRRRPASTPSTASGRSAAILERLGHVRTGTAFAAGVLLGIGGPKRLVLTALAATSIAASGVDGSRAAALVGWYAMLATSLVWVPVAGLVLLGDLALGWLDTALQWLSRHQRTVSFYVLVVIGIVLVLDGAAQL